MTWFLHVAKILKKVSGQDIMQIFCSKIRPVIEYAPVGHHSLTKELSNDLECMKIRAFNIAFRQFPYTDCLKSYEIPTLKVSRIEQCKKLFVKLQFPATNSMNPHCVKNTRNSTKYTLPFCHTSTKIRFEGRPAAKHDYNSYRVSCSFQGPVRICDNHFWSYISTNINICSLFDRSSKLESRSAIIILLCWCLF